MVVQELLPSHTNISKCCHYVAIATTGTTGLAGVIRSVVYGGQYKQVNAMKKKKLL